MQLSSGELAAQERPDAGRLRQEIGAPVAPAPVPSSPLPARTEPVPEPISSGDMRLTVSGFSYSGNSLLDARTLDAALADLTGRPLSFAELQSSTARVAEAYRNAGWIARALLMPQGLADGVVQLQIIEARFGRLRLESGSGDPVRVDLDRLERIVTTYLSRGEPIATAALDRALMLLDELPGVAAQGRLAAGAGEGETDLVVVHAGDRFAGGDIRLDNGGSRSTGRERLTANASLASPAAAFFGGGDSWAATVMKTAGSDYGRLAYARVITPEGAVVGVSASDMRYRLVGADFAALRSTGSSGSAGLDLTLPLVRARTISANFVLAWENKQFDNLSGGTVTSRYAIRNTSATATVQRQDEWMGGGSIQGSVGLVAGYLDLSNSPTQATDAGSTRAQGGFRVLRYSLGRQQAIGEAWKLVGSWRGQIASKNLDSAEKFYLGGSGGVRAYPSSEVGGAEGNLVSLEVATQVAGFEVSGLYDWGRVRVNKDNSFNGAATRNTLALQGIGASVGWSRANGANLRLTWTHRIGSNPNPTAAGKDQDGTLIRHRLWVSAAWVF